MKVDRKFWDGLSLTERERQNFLSHVPRQTNRNGCLVWDGSKFQKTGYGQFQLRGRPVHAHRIALLLRTGRLGVGFVLHKCNRPDCVNPDHLEIGTHRRNMEYMKRCGRSKAGDRHPQAKLSSRDVIKIRKLLKAGKISGCEIARRFGVTSGMIYHIKHRRQWKNT